MNPIIAALVFGWLTDNSSDSTPYRHKSGKKNNKAHPLPAPCG